MKHSEILEQRVRDQMDEAWARMLGTEAGRMIVWSLLDLAGVFRSSLSSDAISMAAAEGARNLGLQVMQERVLPVDGTLETMMRENAARREAIKRAIDEEKENA